MKLLKCYYENKLSKYLDRKCNSPAVIDGKLTDDYSLQTVLFESDFPECIEQTKPSSGKVQVNKPQRAWRRLSLAT